MVTTREIRGSREQIARQLERVEGEIISVILVVEETAKRPLSDEECQQVLKEMEADAADAPNADYSREAMYTRMPGE